MANPRPRRKRKADRLLNPDASKAETQCDYAVAGMDRLATEFDMIWGIDLLPELVSPETASRYGAAMADLNAALGRSDPAGTLACANNCIKGLNVMDAEARKLGRQPAKGDFWEYRLDAVDGDPAFHFAVMTDGHEWQTAKAKRPDLEFYTMREVALALQSYVKNRMVDAVRDKFPEAEIVKIKPKSNRPPMDWVSGDEIPF